MNILAIESSAVAAGCAVVKDGKTAADLRLNAGLTHSQTLMPLIDSAMKLSSLTPEQLDYIAVACGPGSFTGIRIGVATAKGIAFAHNIKCVAVSTLEGAAGAMDGLPGYICPVMDARCSQYYTALFTYDCGFARIWEDEAVSEKELIQRLSALDKDVWLCADGAEKLFSHLAENTGKIKLAPPSMRMQNGCGVAHAAVRMIENGQYVSCDKLLPAYLRLPQAERELLSKSETK